MSTLAPAASHIADVLGVSKRAIEIRAQREAWPYMEQPVRGGRKRFYCLETLPPQVVAAIRSQSLLTSASNQTAVSLAQDKPSSLTNRQRQVAEARAAILMYVHRLAARSGTSRAIEAMVEAARSGTLPIELGPLVSIANDKAGTVRTLASSTLYRWLAKFDLNQPNAVDLLAPRCAGTTKRGNWLREQVAPWADAALKLYQRPQKPTIRWVHEQLVAHVPHGVNAPSYDTLRRFLASMGSVALQTGRMGPRELKNIKPFKRRDTSMLWPSDVYLADGHQFDAEVAHPRHGRPFRPEITAVLDAATRRLLGWSVDLAESGLAVLDALRVATMNGGIGSVFYVDRGPGYINAMVCAPGVGLLARLGMTLTHALPYNSQARGLMERSHRTIWVRAAKELPTFMGADMDQEARHKVHKLTRSDVKQLGASHALMRWPDFVKFAANQVERYNNEPHRGLSQITDPASGKRRHLTPNEAWEKGIAEGAEMVTLTAAEADQLFRPQAQRPVARGEIRLFNNLYFSHDLLEYHGEGVNVGYDIHDPSQIWVHDASGVFICKALLDGNKGPMFAESVLDQASRKRAEGRERRLMGHIAEVREELNGGSLVLENNPSPKAPFLADINDQRVAAAVDAQIVAITQLAALELPTRPLFATPAARYEWLKSEGRDQWNASDRNFLHDYVQDPDGYALFAQRHELLGHAWVEQDERDLNSFDGPSRKVA